MANWEMNWSFGFYKRGLPGALLQPLANSGLLGWNRIEWFQQVGNLLLLTLLVCVFWLVLAGRTNKDRLVSAQLALLMILASPFMVMASNLVGYFDHLVYLIGFGAVALVVRQRYLAAALLLVVCMLIHEMAALTSYPMAVLALMYQQASRGRHPLAFWRYPVLAWALLVLPLLVLASLVYQQTHLLAIEEYRSYLLRQNLENLRTLDFREWKQYHGAEHLVGLLTESYGNFWQEELVKGLGRLQDSGSLLVFVPLLLWALLPIWTATCRSSFRGSLLLFATLACLAPLLLHLIAFDTDRIWLMPVFSILIGRWLCDQFLTFEQDTATELLLDLGAVVLFAIYALMPPVVMVDELALELYSEDYALWYGLPFGVMVWLFVCKYAPLIQIGRRVVSSKS